jgi:hypothetical protein
MLNYRKRRDTNAVVRLTDNAIIGPENELEWEEYQTWLSEGNTPEEPESELLPVPSTISDRQFFQQAAILGVISQAEALAAVQTGTIPPVLQSIVDGIQDPSEKFAATMLLAGATVFERNHPFTNAVGVALGWSTEQIDQFFIDASKL